MCLQYFDVFIFGLFNDAVKSWHHTASSSKITSKWRKRGKHGRKRHYPGI